MKRVALALCMAVILALAVSSSASANEADGKVHTATDENFRNEVLRAGVPVLCVFSASWCKYCRKLKPELDKIASEYKGKVKVVVVDTDKTPDFSHRYRVEGIPALFMHDASGSVTGNDVGYMNKERIIQKFGLDNL